MTTPTGRGYFQHPDDPYGVQRWFDGTNWTARTSGTARPHDPRHDTPVSTDPAAAAYRAYARACGDVLRAVNTCASHANAVMNGRQLTGQFAQHEYAARRFHELTSVGAAEFVPAYKAVLARCEEGRRAAATLLARDPGAGHEAALVAALTVGEYREVGMARIVMGTAFGPTPRRFLEGLAVANEAVEADIHVLGEAEFVGRIYREPEPTHRECPWCAETVRAAAVVCRWCGRRLRESGPPEPASILTKRGSAPA